MSGWCVEADPTTFHRNHYNHVNKSIPKHSMYGIVAYIGVVSDVNVYYIHYSFWAMILPNLTAFAALHPFALLFHAQIRSSVRCAIYLDSPKKSGERSTLTPAGKKTHHSRGRGVTVTPIRSFPPPPVGRTADLRTRNDRTLLAPSNASPDCPSPPPSQASH